MAEKSLGTKKTQQAEAEHPVVGQGAKLPERSGGLWLERFDGIMVVVIVILVAVIGLVIAFGDHVGVKVEGYSPKASDTPDGLTDIRVTFDTPMDKKAVEANFQLRPSAQGTFAWESDDRVMIFTPSGAFMPEETYSVTIHEEGTKSASGRRLREDFKFSFKVRAPFVYFLSPSDAAERSLWRVRFNEGQPTPPEQIYSSQFGVYDMAPSPNGSQIAVTVFAEENRLTEIGLMKPDGTEVRQITQCSPASCGEPTWSPDGTLISYERQEKSDTGGFAPPRIFLYDVQSGQTGPAFQDTQVLGFGAVWSNDSQQIAFYDANSQQARVLNLDTGENYTIPTLNWDGGSFSADGTQLLYTDIKLVENNIYASQLWIATLPTGEGDVSQAGVAPLFEESQEDQAPAWSPSGEWIAFGRRRLNWELDRARQVFLYNVATGEFKQITTEVNYNNNFFRWDASSSRLLIQRFNLETQFPKTEIWMYNLRTEALTLITTDGYEGRWAIIQCIQEGVECL